MYECALYANTCATPALYTGHGSVSFLLLATLATIKVKLDEVSELAKNGLEEEAVKYFEMKLKNSRDR